MEFVGFSSDEEKESTPLPPIPPDIIPVNLSSTSNASPTFFQIQDMSVFLPPPCPTSPSDSFKTSSNNITAEVQVNQRRIGRPKADLPAGCKVFLDDNGDATFVCNCQTTFSEKKNLLRHIEVSCSKKSPKLTRKRKRSEGRDYEDYPIPENPSEEVIEVFSPICRVRAWKIAIEIILQL